MRKALNLEGFTLSPLILAAFDEVDHELFLFNADGSRVMQSTNPHLMAMMLECLDTDKGQTILEIGTGSGFNSALIASLIGSEGTLNTIEVDCEVARNAIEKLNRSGVNNVNVICGDGWYGYNQQEKYDRIIAAAKPPFIPQPWVEQLNIEGILVVPIDLELLGSTYIVTFKKQTENELISLKILNGGFIPMAPTSDQLILKPSDTNRKPQIDQIPDINTIQIIARRDQNNKREWIDKSIWDNWDLEYINL
jgi:protein-L-isoaspartate(D-aspartate) O-methyltransferase